MKTHSLFVDPDLKKGQYRNVAGMRLLAGRRVLDLPRLDITTGDVGQIGDYEYGACAISLQNLAAIQKKLTDYRLYNAADSSGNSDSEFVPSHIAGLFHGANIFPWLSLRRILLGAAKILPDTVPTVPVVDHFGERVAALEEKLAIKKEASLEEQLSEPGRTITPQSISSWRNNNAFPQEKKGHPFRESKLASLMQVHLGVSPEDIEIEFYATRLYSSYELTPNDFLEAVQLAYNNCESAENNGTHLSRCLNNLKKVLSEAGRPTSDRALAACLGVSEDNIGTWKRHFAPIELLILKIVQKMDKDDLLKEHKHEFIIACLATKIAYEFKDDPKLLKKVLNFILTQKKEKQRIPDNYFSQLIDDICVKNDWNYEKFATELKVDAKVLNRWVQGKGLPALESLHEFMKNLEEHPECQIPQERTAAIIVATYGRDYAVASSSLSREFRIANFYVPRRPPMEESQPVVEVPLWDEMGRYQLLRCRTSQLIARNCGIEFETVSYERATKELLIEDDSLLEGFLNGSISLDSALTIDPGFLRKIWNKVDFPYPSADALVALTRGAKNLQDKRYKIKPVDGGYDFLATPSETSGKILRVEVKATFPEARNIGFTSKEWNALLAVREESPYQIFLYLNASTSNSRLIRYHDAHHLDRYPIWKGEEDDAEKTVPMSILQKLAGDKVWNEGGDAIVPPYALFA